jgi:hypothetical protein
MDPDDKLFLVVDNEFPAESKSNQSSPSSRPGMSLDFKSTAGADGHYGVGGAGGRGLSGAKREGEEGIQETECTVVFELPDGSQGESVFRLGQTVEVLKSYVANEFGIPMEDQNLYLDDSEQSMLGPLSLIDFASVKRMFGGGRSPQRMEETEWDGKDAEKEIYVRVEGPMPMDARK